MNRVLPSDFCGHRYGLMYRLVTFDDAPFIVGLRTDPKLSRFIHETSSEVSSQIDWIREYKDRESRGEDYYFIFHYKDEPVGVCRLYGIHDCFFTFGSWLFKEGIPFFCSVAGAIIAREIAFEELGLEEEIEKDGTLVENKKVIRFSKQLGMVYNGTRKDSKGIFKTGYLKKEAFEKNKKDICRFLGEQ